MSQRGATPPAGARRLAVPGRLRVTAVAGLSWALCRLPEAPLVSLANAAGDLWYRLAPERAARARRNLGRVVSSLAASGRASESVRVAARDPLALERLVRLAFRHNVRYYLEVARLPTLTPSVIDRILQVETPDTVDEAFDGGGPVVFVGLHFGAIELPGLYLARRTGRRPLAPMETLDDPALQRWLERTRSTVGVQIVGLREARRTLLAAIRRGDPVGLIADRDITG
ncbi:MAG TPA: hypothetical protein VIV06_03895, partial [Candidatus Limnocylindrales bacterium]